MKTFLKLIPLCTLLHCALNLCAADRLLSDAEQALDKAIAFYRSIAISGGYLDRYSLDVARIGNSRTMVGRKSRDVYIDNDHTALIGSAYLRAHAVTGKESYLHYAGEVADALVRAQNPLGGWGRRFYFDGRSPEPYCDLWYPPTRNALLFLMSSGGAAPREAVKKGLAFMIESQFENGAWPPYYPLEARFPEGFAAPYFFNDGTTTECLNVVIEAHKRYGDPALLKTAKRAGDFICLSQLPPPQSGWAQQYNRHLQPAWYRHFEPASVCSLATFGCLQSLIELYLHTGLEKYLDPVPDSLRWLRESRLENGRWARFYELGTNKPLYYDWGRKRVSSIRELSPERQIGYRYELDLDVEVLESVYRQIVKLGREAYLNKRERKNRLEELEQAVRQIVLSQKADGSWVTLDTGKYLPPGKTKWVEWNGERKNEEILSSTTFRNNLLTLCDFIEAFGR